MQEGGALIKKAGNLFTTSYLLLIFGVYPFYMHQGYVDIAKVKYHFFLYSSLAVLIILAVLGVICGGQMLYCRIKQREPYLIDWNSLSLTDMFVILYATEIFISYVFSYDRKEAFWGTEGWYMGWVLLFTLCALYFGISRFLSGNKAVWHVAVLASGVVFLLGIFDRFSIYLIPLKVRDPAFISTLGNINWFCGYLSVIAPIGISLFLFGTEKKWMYGIYTFIVFLAGFCQGGSSIFLFWGALFFVLLWIAIKKKAWIENYLLLLSLWGFSAQAMGILRYIIPEGYNYDIDCLCARLSKHPFTLLVGIGSLGIYMLLRMKKTGEISKKVQSVIHKVMVMVLAAGALLYLMLAGLNNQLGILSFGQSDLFSFSEAWGNSRGAAIAGGIEAYRQMPLSRKLIGVGPDCFSVYIYSLEEVAAMLRDNFGSSRLTNAHNELLTCLINTGIIGTCLFVGIFTSFVWGCLKKGRDNPAFYLFVVCVICYFVHNTISFAQVLNFPFLFLLLGIGESIKRAKRFSELTN